MLKRLRRFIAAATIAVALPLALPAVAGASAPCPIGDQGWYQSGVSVFQCAINGNHVNQNEHFGDGSKLVGSWQSWYPAGTYLRFIPGALGTQWAAVDTCPIPWHGVTAVSFTGANKPYNVQKSNGTYANEGILWMTKERPINTITCEHGQGARMWLT